MHGSGRIAATGAIVVFTAAGACRDRRALGESGPPVNSTGVLTDACAGDSLRPAAAAPAPGLWSYARGSGERVAAMIGPARQDDQAPVVTHPVESMEVSAMGDTVRHRLDAATVSLELLPPPRSLGGNSAAESPVGTQPAATYVVSPRVRLAAYEPCATSSRGPRLRYLRRDAAGRIVTDVMLHRASEQ